MSQDAKFRAEDARHLLDNKLFKEAFAAVGAYLEQRALGCDPDNKEMAQRIVLSKQILAGVKREIERVISDGDVEAIRIAEVERRKGVLSVFKR